MKFVELPWETWPAVIDVLPSMGQSYMWEHADRTERQLDQQAADEPIERLILMSCSRSYNSARPELGIHRPPMEPCLLMAAVASRTPTALVRSNQGCQK